MILCSRRREYKKIIDAYFNISSNYRNRKQREVLVLKCNFFSRRKKRKFNKKENDPFKWAIIKIFLHLLSSWCIDIYVEVALRSLHLMCIIIFYMYPLTSTFTRETNCALCIYANYDAMILFFFTTIIYRSIIILRYIWKLNYYILKYVYYCGKNDKILISKCSFLLIFDFDYFCIIITYH